MVDNEKNENANKSFVQLVKENFTAITITATIISIIGGIIVVSTYIKGRIDDVVYSEKYMQEISKFLRPYVIFDQYGRVFLNHGGYELLDSIHIEPTQGYGSRIHWPEKIIVTSKQWLAYPPNLQLPIGYMAHVSVERGQKYDWVYNVTLAGFAVSGGDTSTVLKFTLEIVK